MHLVQTLKTAQLCQIYLFPVIPAKIEAVAKRNDRFPLPLSKLFQVTPELYTLVSRPKLHVFNRGYWEGSYFFGLEEMVVLSHGAKARR